MRQSSIREACCWQEGSLMGSGPGHETIAEVVRAFRTFLNDALATHAFARFGLIHEHKFLAEVPRIPGKRSSGGSSRGRSSRSGHVHSALTSVLTPRAEAPEFAGMFDPRCAHSDCGLGDTVGSAVEFALHGRAGGMWLRVAVTGTVLRQRRPNFALGTAVRQPKHDHTSPSSCRGRGFETGRSGTLVVRGVPMTGRSE